METLPTKLKIKGKDYILEESQFSKHSEVAPGWWCFMYRPLDNQGMPPEVHDEHDWYYLCSVAENKEEAYNDMLERVNSMILD